MAIHPKRPRDPNQLAKMVLDIAVGEIEDADPNEGKSAKAVKAGWMGGKKGGRARAENLSPERRREIAQIAARVRWKKSD